MLIRTVQAWGVLQFGFGRDVPRQNLKVGLHKYQFFRKGDPFIYQSDQVCAKYFAKSLDLKFS